MVVTGETLQTVAWAMIGPTDMGCVEKRKAEITWSAQLKSLSLNPLRRALGHGYKYNSLDEYPRIMKPNGMYGEKNFYDSRA